MAMKLKDNPEGCVDPKRRGKRTCLECFWAQVNDENQWTGNKRCWDAPCIVEERGALMMTMYPIVRVRLTKDAPMPAYAHEGDAGMDLCATEDVTLLPGEWCMVGSGVACAIPKGFVGLVVPRSGLGCEGLVLKHVVGVIDSPYRGEIKLPLFNNNPTHLWEKSYSEKFSQKFRRAIYDLLLRPCLNRGNVSAKGTIHVRKGDRVAQLLIVPVAHASLVQVDTLDETERQDGGFGSTGITGGERL